MDCNSLQYRVYYHVYHNYIGIDKCSGPPYQSGPWENTPSSPPSQWAWLWRVSLST